jgi:hypothetical protein
LEIGKVLKGSNGKQIKRYDKIEKETASGTRKEPEAKKENRNI